MYRSCLDQFIPIARDDDWILSVWRESNTAHPVSVTVILEEREREREQEREGGREKEKKIAHVNTHHQLFNFRGGRLIATSY